VKNYVIPRRRGWASTEALEAAEARSRRVGEQDLPHDVRWIRTYVVREEDGSLGTFCIYQATGPEAIREHASLAGVPADEILEIALTNVVRPDPERTAA
jgi:Protein of unknown function (DUF4242)